MVRKLFLSMVVLAGLLGSSAPTWAGLNMRNDTEDTINVAIAYQEGGAWHVRGWYVLTPGETKQALTGNLDQRYYYYYAYSESGGLVWEGPHNFYLHPVRAFDYFRVNDVYGSLPRSAVMKGFRQLDTGDDLDHLLYFQP